MKHLKLMIFLNAAFGLVILGTSLWAFVKSDVGIRTRFVELDRDGLLSPDGLRGEEKKYGYSTDDLSYRNVLSDYLGASAGEGIVILGLVGSLSCLANLVIGITAMVGARRTGSGDRTGT